MTRSQRYVKKSLKRRATMSIVCARRRHFVAEHGGRQFDQGQRRGLERFDEAGGKPDGDAVAVPELAAIAGLERELPWRAHRAGHRRSFAGRPAVRAPRPRQLVCALENTCPTPRRAGSPMSQIHPACLGGRNRLRGDGRALGSVWHLQGQRGIVEQHLLLRHERHPEMVA